MGGVNIGVEVGGMNIFSKFQLRNTYGLRVKVFGRCRADLPGRRHSVQMSLACALSLAIFWVLLQSW